MPTNTWQAYNFYDADGDGWGDTWYAGGNQPVDLTRPFRDRGVPPRYKRYDLPFLRWLHRTGREPEILAEDDLEAIASGDDLRRLYDLIVFPGHTEYVTAHEYDVIERFRDLGGRLVFLSSNNFFWRVDRDGDRDHARPHVARPRLARRRGCSACSTARTTTAACRGSSGSRTRARGGPVVLRGHGARGGLDLRRVGRRLRDRDRHAHPRLPAGDDPPLPRPRPLRARPQRRDDVLRDRGGRAGLLGGRARLRAPRSPSGPCARMLENLWQRMLEDVPPPPAPPGV